MTEHEDAQVPETETDEKMEAAIPPNQDVSINGDADETPAADGAAPVSRPAFGKIFNYVLAIIAILMLWGIAGGVNEQGCIAKWQATYPNTVGKSGALAATALKGHITECSNSSPVF
jgi:hypothetical protein